PTPLARTMSKLCIAQLVILLVIFRGNVLHYALLWLVPLFTFNLVLLRVRGIAEHGGPTQRRFEIERPDQGNRYTRSMLTPFKPAYSRVWSAVETLLIGSLSVNFHHEHHLLPRVPFYNLKRLHNEIAAQVAGLTPEAYESSYVGALLRGGSGLAHRQPV